MRDTTFDFAGAFGRHLQGAEVEYMNIFGIPASREMENKYHLAILTTDLLGLRSAPCWNDVQKRLVRLTRNIPKIVMFPQDDYTYSSRLDRLASVLNVFQIWTPISTDLEKLYPKSIRRGVAIKSSLTGYIEGGFQEKYLSFSKAFLDRTVDLGQRVRFLPAQFGAIGIRKAKLATEFARKAREKGFRVDVSTDEKQTLYGDDWLRFLGNTRFTISRKGGASLADTRNSMALSLIYLAGLFPKVKPWLRDLLACRFGVRSGKFSAESPRLFEAAALNVCQVLEEDEYLDGALRPWVHYIPLRPDFSNVEDILSFMKDEKKCSTIIASAKNELIESGKYTYSTFINRFQIEVDIGFHTAPSRVTDLDLDFSSDVRSFPDVIAYFQKGPKRRNGFRHEKNHFDAFYAELTQYESIPETLFQPWIPASARLKF
jgi:hypothetical protein